jgi:hypothetical protein
MASDAILLSPKYGMESLPDQSAILVTAQGFRDIEYVLKVFQQKSATSTEYLTRVGIMYVMYHFFGILKSSLAKELPACEGSPALFFNLSCLESTANNGQGRTIAQILMDHKPQNSHHCRSAIVQLDSSLLQLPGITLLVPPKVQGTVTEVTWELTGRGAVGRVLHDKKFEEAYKGQHLKKTLLGDGVGSEKRGNTVGVGIEGVAGVVNVAREMDAGTGGDLTQEGELGDAAVLELDVAELVEALLVGTRKEEEWIVKAGGHLNADLVGIIGRERSGRGRLRGGRKGSGGASEERADGELVHDDYFGLGFGLLLKSSV